MTASELPRIGITCDFEPATDPDGLTARFVSPAAYSEAVRAAGGVPILLPHTPPEQAAAVLAAVSALLVSGGDFDVPPEYYGEGPHAGLGKLVETRSSFERAVLELALARGIPVLGVCGGMQLLNVVMGGTLYQDVSERPDTGVHEQAHPKTRPQHSVDLQAASLVERCCGCAILQVNSTHHQLVHQVGQGLLASARAPDGVVEAIETSAGDFVLGVQWHPESLLDDPAQLGIYQSLVRAAQKPSK